MLSKTPCHPNPKSINLDLNSKNNTNVWLRNSNHNIIHPNYHIGISAAHSNTKESHFL